LPGGPEILLRLDLLLGNEILFGLGFSRRCFRWIFRLVGGRGEGRGIVTGNRLGPRRQKLDDQSAAGGAK
jgi:hypothetical protein